MAGDLRNHPRASAVYRHDWFTSPAQRREEIARSLADLGPDRRSYPVGLSAGYKDVPVVRLPHTVLAYRVENGRLIAEREKAFDLAGLSGRCVTGETLEEQTVLHQLLIAHADDPRGPILAELARARRQVEPLLATRAGVVVNGNRRLAAMRSLTLEEKGESPFEEVEVAVLPEGIAPAEIEYLEASLQMAPETKLGYGWPNRRMKLREQRDVLHLPPERMAEAYRLENMDQLEREIGELALAERYLAWADAPGAWERLEDGWHLVEALAAHLPPLPDDMRAIWQAMGFLAIRHRETTDPGKAFPFAPPLTPQHPRLAARRIASLAGLVDETEPDDQKLRAALEHFASNGDASRAAEIGEVMATLRQEHQERVAPMRALAQLKQTGAMLQRLEPERLSAPQRRQLRSDLAALTVQAEYLLGEIAEPRQDRNASWNRRKRLLDPPYGKILPRIIRRLSGS